MEKIKRAAEQLTQQVASALVTIQAEAQRLDDASRAATGGKIQEVTPCKVTQRIGYSLDNFASTSSWHRPHWTANVSAARAEITAARADLEVQHAANLPAIENNRLVIQQVKLIMANLGIPEVITTYGYATSRARKMTRQSKQAGYVSDLEAVCKTSDNYESLKRSIDDFERRVADYEKRNQDQEAQVKRAEEEKRKVEDRLKVLGALAQKYGCPADSEAEDVLDAIFERDKYLRLAHYLQCNRNDWNEGPSYAENGLYGFKVETDEDQAIYDDIYRHIEDWDGDGRVFRDTEYSYDVLFGKADAELRQDYNKMHELKLVSQF